MTTQETEKEIAGIRTQIALMEERLKNLCENKKGFEDNIKVEIKELRDASAHFLTEVEGLLGNYVTSDRFKPVETIAYGIAGATLMAALGAVLKLIL